MNGPHIPHQSSPRSRASSSKRTPRLLPGALVGPRRRPLAYAGFQLVEPPTFCGLVDMHRWYIADPIGVQSSLRWMVEHGGQEVVPPLDDGCRELRDRFFEARQRAREPTASGSRP